MRARPSNCTTGTPEDGFLASFRGAIFRKLLLRKEAQLCLLQPDLILALGLNKVMLIGHVRAKIFLFYLVIRRVQRS